MAVETIDYASVLNFINQAKIQNCFIRAPEVPGWISDEQSLPHLIPYLDLGLTSDYDSGQSASRQSGPIQAFATGWTRLEGVMLVQPELEFDADIRVAITASSERALRDLLLSFPAGKTGFCYLGGDWMLPAVAEVLEGCAMPSREGYYASEQTFTPIRNYPAKKLEPDDYSLVQTQWSESVWEELCSAGFAVHACHMAAELCALCFHWSIEHWRHEVHGLQAVKDYSRPFAESVITTATEEVIAQGKVATCTANLANNTNDLRAFRQVGYRPFYRVPSYLGIKRGSGAFAKPSESEFYAGSGRKPRPSTTAIASGAGRRIGGSKAPVLVQAADLAHASGRRERSQFVVEGLMLVQRAIDDGLSVDNLLYTPDLLTAPEGIALLSAAYRAGIDHYLITEGLMGKVTTTRPVPPVLAAVFARLRTVEGFHVTERTALLVAENINNPDNLGMILRTADAAGAEGVLVAGEKSDPFHKNCVRAARGAVGRIPIVTSQVLDLSLLRLQKTGVTVIGTALDADNDLYRCPMRPPVAVVVGNEQTGITRETLEACTTRLRIPMVPGQDSLNVGVAAGLLLYEIFRRQQG